MTIRDRENPVSVHPAHPRFKDSVENICSTLGVDYLVAQQLGFNNKVSDFHLGDEAVDGGVERLLRTKEKTEALVLPRKSEHEHAGVVMNADCIIIYFWHEKVFGLVHAPIASLDPDKQENRVPVTFAIVDHIRKHYDADMVNTYWAVAYGAGPESFGYDLNHPKFGAANQAMLERLAPWHTSGREVLFAPRKGWAAIDQYEIIERQLREAGAQHIEMDRTDTSSLGLTPAQMEEDPTLEGDCFSNIRSGMADRDCKWNSRNASLIASC